MFSYLKGTLVEMESQQQIILDVNGIGYSVIVPTSLIPNLPSKGTEIKLYVYLAVRQDGLELYGFIDKEERILFEKLISVSGIGPKGAISMLSVLTPTQLALAIATGDIKTLSTAPGVGKKTSQRIILELKEKIDKAFLSNSKPSYDELIVADGPMKEAIQALIALGYQANDARRALDSVDSPNEDTSTLVRLALKALDKR
jgi:Holliday junction DNA helicase RuvA